MPRHEYDGRYLTAEDTNMIDSVGRRAYGDQRTDWAGICANFRGLQDRASQYGYSARLERMADQVRQGHRRIADWHALLGELSELAADEEYVTWRDDRRAAFGAWPSSLDPAGSGFMCPGDLCSRRHGPSVEGAPACGLLRRSMTDLRSDSGTNG